LADAEEDSISFLEKDFALLRAFVANAKAYDERKRVREEAEDAEDSSFQYRSIYLYMPEHHPTGIPNAVEFCSEIPLPTKCGSNMSLTA
jgi:hypothetical protein